MTIHERRGEFRKDAHVYFTYTPLDNTALKIAEEEYQDKNCKTHVVFADLDDEQRPGHVNISASGMTLCGKQRGSQGDYIALTLKLNQGGETMHIIAKVLECSEGFNSHVFFLRLQFTHISEKHQESIRRFTFEEH